MIPFMTINKMNMVYTDLLMLIEEGCTSYDMQATIDNLEDIADELGIDLIDLSE